MTFGKMKRKIKKLREIVKLPDGNYSKEDDNFIKEIIMEFREFMKYLSQENRNEFEETAKNYKENLNDLIEAIDRFTPIIQSRYNKSTMKKIRKTAWDRKY